MLKYLFLTATTISALGFFSLQSFAGVEPNPPSTVKDAIVDMQRMAQECQNINPQFSKGTACYKFCSGKATLMNRWMNSANAGIKSRGAKSKDHLWVECNKVHDQAMAQANPSVAEESINPAHSSPPSTVKGAIADMQRMEKECKATQNKKSGATCHRVCQRSAIFLSKIKKSSVDGGTKKRYWTRCYDLYSELIKPA